MDVIGFALKVVLALGVILLFRRLVPAFVAWAFARPLFTVLIGVVFSVLYRVVGVDYGVPDLFWHEDPFVQFWAGFWVVLVRRSDREAVFRGRADSRGDGARLAAGRRASRVGGGCPGRGRDHCPRVSGQFARAAQPAAPTTPPAEKTSVVTQAILRRVYSSDEEISKFLGPPPEWVRKKPGTGDAGAGTAAQGWAPYSFGLYFYKMLLTLLLTILLLVPPVAASVVDRAWAWLNGRDHGPVWGDLILPIGALCGSLVVVCIIVAWEFILRGKGYELFASLMHSVPWGTLGTLGWLIVQIASFAVTVVTFVSAQLPASSSICILLMDIALVTGGLRWLTAKGDQREGKLRPAGTWVNLVGLLVLTCWVAWANGRDPYKLSFPHLELANGRCRSRTAPPIERLRDANAHNAGLIADRAALAAWQAAQHAGRSGARPRLAVVAVSGGGIAAAVWTARNLKALELTSGRFPAALRVVTGASGGMLARPRMSRRCPNPQRGSWPATTKERSTR